MSYWALLVAVLDIVLAMGATVHIVLRKRDTRAAIAWTGFVWLTPMLGVFLYWCLGINRIERKALSLRIRESWNPPAEITHTAEDAQRAEQLATAHPNLIGLESVGHKLTGRRPVPGNRVATLVNGDEAYPAMLEAIDGAERSVALLTYIFDSDRAGQAFLEALARARDRGVEVRVLIDDVGSRYSKPSMFELLEEAGIPAAAFLPTRVPRLFHYANLRNHRKILVVDGRIGFTGGTNIREGHWLSLEPAYPVECVHFRLEGPVVAQLQEVFAIDWAFAAGESLAGERWFPDLARAGGVWARGIPDGPDEDFEKVQDTMLGALSSARSTIRIMTPYFLPESALIRGINTAALRGVDVRIYVPEENNIRLVQWASTAMFWQLLAKGCRIFLAPPPFDHTKLLTVDGVWSLIGSSNWDARSLRLNFEFNVECYDESFAADLDALIDRKAHDAREITLDEVDGRPLPIRLRDGLARLGTPYL